jgi:hypothetical protein
MTEEEMVKCLDIFDQTVGCHHCGQAWWMENAIPQTSNMAQG